MSWQLMIFNLFFFIAIGLVIFSLSYAISKRDVPLAKRLMILSVVVLIYIIGYAFELNSTSLEQMKFWNIIQYIGLPFIPALWMLLALSFTGLKKIKYHLYLLLFTIPLLTLVLRLTNEFHLFYYQDMRLVTDGTFPIMVLDKGPWYYVQTAYLIAVLIGSIFVFIRLLRSNNQEIRLIVRRLIVAASVPIVGLILNISPLSAFGLDYGALLIPISIVLFSSIVSKQHFLSLKTMVLNRFFEAAEQGLLVFDSVGNLIDINEYAVKKVPLLKKYLMKSAQELMADFPAINLLWEENFVQEFEYEGNYYQLHKSRLYDGMQHYIGTVIIFIDITNNVTAIKKLEKTQADIRYMSLHDQLTDLYNRHYLEQYLKELKDRDHPIALLFVDLNDLKKINDTLGHLAGDQSLTKIAFLIKEYSDSQNGIAIRVGGDEFLLLLPHQNEEKTKEQVKVLSDILNQDFSVSIGFAVKKVDTAFEAAFLEAENDMYAHKLQTKKDR